MAVRERHLGSDLRPSLSIPSLSLSLFPAVPDLQALDFVSLSLVFGCNLCDISLHCEDIHRW
jgi:hypothetical protein